MCSIIILYRPGHDWPVLIAANRDEMVSRLWRVPGRHWPDRPTVVAGLDELAGGAWLGLNDHGVMATILNRVGTLGPVEGKRSRGELVLNALDHADAGTAVRAVCALDPIAYRPFNILVADGHGAYWLCYQENEAERMIQAWPIPPGLSMLTALDLNDRRDPRLRDHWPIFAAAPFPRPESGEWSAWQALLASHTFAPDAGPKGAMCFMTENGFGTTSSSLMALPAPHRLRWPIWLFADGPPDRADYKPVAPFTP